MTVELKQRWPFTRRASFSSHAPCPADRFWLFAMRAVFSVLVDVGVVDGNEDDNWFWKHNEIEQARPWVLTFKLSGFYHRTLGACGLVAQVEGFWKGFLKGLLDFMKGSFTGSIEVKQAPSLNRRSVRSSTACLESRGPRFLSECVVYRGLVS